MIRSTLVLAFVAMLGWSGWQTYAHGNAMVKGHIAGMNAAWKVAR